MESQPQNPEFRINPENFHPCKHWLSQDICLYQVIMTLHFLNDIVHDVEST